MNPPSRTSTPQSQAAGRWYLAFLGISLVLIGSIFIWLMGRSFLRAWEMRKWPEVRCIMISSELDERQHDANSPTEYRHRLSFGYEWQGQAYTGDHFSLRGNSWSSKQQIASQRVRKYPVGMETTCRVDPQQPSFAVLQPDSLAPGYSIWFPALFVIGGLGITIRAAMRTRR